MPRANTLIDYLDMAASAISPYAKQGAMNVLPEWARPMGEAAWDQARAYSRDPYQFASDATEAAYNLMPPAQFYKGYRDLHGVATDENAPLLEKLGRGGQAVMDMATSDIPGLDDAVKYGVPAAAMMIGPKSPMWEKLVQKSDYEDVPMGAFSSLYFGKGKAPMVEVYSPTSLAPSVEDLQARRGKLMEMISPTADMKQYEGRMKDFVKDPVGYAAYPESAFNPVSLTMDRRAPGATGAAYPSAYDPGSPFGMSNRLEASAPDREQLLQAIRHERPHPIGRLEWDAAGGDPFRSGSMQAYEGTPGEIYARGEARVAGMTPEQRAADIGQGMWPKSGLMHVGDETMPVQPFWEYADMPPELSGLTLQELERLQYDMARGRAGQNAIASLLRR